MKFRLAPLGLAAVLSVVALGCSGDDDTGISSDPCPVLAMQPCDDDVPVTQAQVDACESASASACGASFKAYQLCTNENLKCTSGKMTDTAAQAAACSSQAAAYQTCTNGSTPDAGH